MGISAEQMNWQTGRCLPSNDVDSARIVFCGDWGAYKGFMTALAQEPEAVYGDTLDVIRDADFRVLNLECALGGDTALLKSGPLLRGGPEHLAALKHSGAELVTLGNNHVCDYGASGVAATLALLQEAGIDSCGAGMNKTQAERTPIHVIRGVRVGFVSFTENGSDLPVAGEHSYGLPGWDEKRLAERVREACQACDCVVALMHAGCEYIPYPPAYVQHMARTLVDAGACAVIAHHPHVPQGIEFYQGAPIAYSIGNFMFPNVGLVRNTEGYIVRLSLSISGVTGLELFPYTISENYRVTLMAGAARDAFLEMLRELSQPFVAGEGEAAWHGVLAARWLARYHESIWQEDIQRFAEAPERAGATLRNRHTKDCHVHFWHDYFSRMAEGTLADAPQWAIDMTRRFQEKIHP